jgi:hypothetical protein
MKKCSKCGTVNEDWARYCNYCGNSFLYDENQFKSDINQENTYQENFNTEEDHHNLILISYILSIIFGWGWIPLLLISSLSNIGVFGFFGLFLPFYMINSPDKNIRKHGYIQFFICILGFAISIILMISMF